MLLSITIDLKKDNTVKFVLHFCEECDRESSNSTILTFGVLHAGRHIEFNRNSMAEQYRHITLRLDEKTGERLRRICEDTEIERSTIMRIALREYMKQIEKNGKLCVALSTEESSESSAPTPH